MTQNPWNPSTSMDDLGWEKQNQEEDILCKKRRDQIGTSMGDLGWEKQNQEEDIP